MTPQEALENWERYGGHVALPQIYRDMGLERLRIVVAESAKPPPRDPMDRIAPPRLGYNALDRMLGREAPAPVAPAAVPVAAADAAPKALVDKAMRNPERLHTARRQRVSFLYHLKVCGSVEQAAAKAGVNRGTLYRWRRTKEGFAARWDDIVAQRAREVGDNIVLQAGQVQVDPIFYGGKQVGERRRVDTRLMIHVQRRTDVERHRAEDRAERRERALLQARPLDEAGLAERIAGLVSRNLASQRLEMSRSVTPAASADEAPSASDTRELKDAA